MRAGGAGYPVVESSPLPGASTTAGGAVLAGSIPSQFQANFLPSGIIKKRIVSSIILESHLIII